MFFQTTFLKKLLQAPKSIIDQAKPRVERSLDACKLPSPPSLTPQQINVSQLPAVNYLVRSVSVIYETDITEDNRTQPIFVPL